MPFATCEAKYPTATGSASSIHPAKWLRLMNGPKAPAATQEIGSGHRARNRALELTESY
jgi:hypothetical protein